MQIDVSNRSACLSVGEFAQFRSGPREGGFSRSGRWRTEAGQRWHKELQSQAEQEHEQTGAPLPVFEKVIRAVIPCQNWRIELQGRIDQVVNNGSSLVFREVKSVQRPLPEEEDQLHRDYPEYFAQAATYQVMAGSLSEYEGMAVSAELVFVDIGSGVVQKVPLREEAEDIFQQQLDLLVAFLNARLESKDRIADADFRLPFSDLRPGQESAAEALARTSRQARVILFEAPTGFGKTGFALHFALGRLQEGEIERVIYLTGKSTGQVQVTTELDRNWGRSIRYHQMRSKLEHAIDSPMHSCLGYGASCRANISERWAQAALDPAKLIEQGPLTLDRAKAIGEETGICPFEISRSVLPFVEVWIGDYNYIFHPRSSGVFLNQPAFDPARTLVLIDEAHNLPGRVADAWSGAVHASRLRELSVELTFCGAASSLRRALDSVLSFVDSLAPSEALDMQQHYELRDLLETYYNELQCTPLNFDIIQGSAIESLWELADLLYTLDHEHLEVLLWSPEPSVLNVTCHDASWEIARLLRQFQQSVLMSATLSPVDVFVRSCGLEEGEVARASFAAPWRENVYDVAVDARVDTTFRKRSYYYGQTADAIAALANQSSLPVVAFFPSYKYAEIVANELSERSPGLMLQVQPRGLNLADQRAFIEEALIGAHIIFLVLGSGFAEGIDALGGRIFGAIIVGPALPEVDAVQAARLRQRDHLSSAEAFREVYAVPGMRKINQALGRLVRAPGQSARVLLHCRRFAQDGYQELLDPHFRPGAVIRSDADFEKWLYKDD